jgi:nucleotide-binding universal stress UspA family protein
MKNILVPIDFSDASFNALSYAAFLANAFKVPLTLVHAYKSVSAFDEIPRTKIPASQKQADAENEKFLKNEMEGIVKKFTVKIDSIIKKGNPVNVIRKIAEEKHSDLIIMGMKGKGESNSKFGSTTTAVINETDIPLLVIPKKANYQTIDTITLASDFSHEKLLSNFPILEKMIERFDPFIQVLNVQKKNSKLTAEFIANKMSTDLMWDKYNHSFNIIERDDIEEGISKFLKNHPTDLLIMIARKRNFITKIIQPSHTKKMTYQTKIPLLVLHEEIVEK